MSRLYVYITCEVHLEYAAPAKLLVYYYIATHVSFAIIRQKFYIKNDIKGSFKSGRGQKNLPRGVCVYVPVFISRKLATMLEVTMDLHLLVLKMIAFNILLNCSQPLAF